MNIRYTLEDKPDFFDGELVDVDMSAFGLPPEILTGKIVGKASTNIIDNWLVEFPRAFPPSYLYQVVSTPHTFIIKN